MIPPSPNSLDLTRTTQRTRAPISVRWINDSKDRPFVSGKKYTVGAIVREKMVQNDGVE